MLQLKPVLRNRSLSLALFALLLACHIPFFMYKKETRAAPPSGRTLALSVGTQAASLQEAAALDQAELMQEADEAGVEAVQAQTESVLEEPAAPVSEAKPEGFQDPVKESESFLQELAEERALPAEGESAAHEAAELSASDAGAAAVGAGVTEGDGSDGAEEGFDGDEIRIAQVREVVLSRIEKNKLYPRQARRRGLEGEVSLFFVVSADGSLAGLRIERSQANALLEQAALQAVQKSFPMELELGFPLEMRVTLRFALSA